MSVTVWILGVAFLGVLCSATLWTFALRRRRRHGDAPSIDVVLSIAEAVFAGVAVTLGVFVLQQSLSRRLDRATASADFVSRVLMTADLTGFDPPPTPRPAWNGHSCHMPAHFAFGGSDDLDRLAGVSLAAKDLEGARLDGMNLRGTILHDARLVGTTFTCGSLEGANLQRADLSGADLTAVSLQGADLRGARLDGLIWAVQSWRGDMVEVSTCWPPDGPWGRQSPSRWMHRAGVHPYWDGGWRPAYGHFCTGRPGVVIGVAGRYSRRHVPVAIGHTDARSDRVWKQNVLRALVALRRREAGR